jgi:hypothetical protein
MFALASPFLIGAAGLATEGGLWLYVQQSVQSDADSSALSAANAYAASASSSLANQANAVSATYGYQNGKNGTTVAVNQPPTSGSYTANSKAVEVIVSTQQQRLLSSIFTTTPVTITGRAVAVPGSSGSGCVLALDKSASAAFSAQGNTTVVLKGCGIYDNSSSSSGLSAGGTASITADSANVVGGVSGSSNFTTTQGINTGAAAITDPYANVTMPKPSGCDADGLSVKNTATLNPGTYCNGLQLNAGANVTLNPGVYIIDRGSLSIAGGATLSGNGVTLVFTSSTGSNYASATINGGATVQLTAPTTGATAGIVFFGDRNMPTNTTFKFNGGAGQIVDGAIYTPSGALQYAGGASTSLDCTQLIGNTVTFTGNSQLALNCSKYNTTPFGASVSVLVE